MPIGYDDNNDTKLAGATDDTPIGNVGDRLKTEALETSDGAGTQAALTIGLTSVVVRAGGSNLADRRYVTVFNNGNQTIYWGRTSGVTTSSGTPIFKNQFVSFRIGPNADLYLISGFASQDVRITEQA